MYFIIRINRGNDTHSAINAGILMHSISIILIFCGRKNQIRIENIYVHKKCNIISIILYRKLVMLFMYNVMYIIIEPIIKIIEPNNNCNINISLK